MITRFSLCRISGALALTLLCSSSAMAQTMRFTTSVGTFDMELNPTNDPNLQPLVDNIVAYIGLGRYGHTGIVRAVEGGPGTADDFVLQMGGFLGFPDTPNNYLGLVQPVEALLPVIVDQTGDGVPDFDALANTRGTVSLALQAGNPNSGTSSFFINLKDNSQGENSLDAQGFVPFARVVDLTTIDRIMALNNVDLNGAAQSAFDDVPLLENGRLVILKSVHVLEAAPDFSFVGPISTALARQAAASAASTAASSAASQADSSESELQAAVPEPSTIALGLAGGIGVLLASRRGRRGGVGSCSVAS